MLDDCWRHPVLTERRVAVAAGRLERDYFTATALYDRLFPNAAGGSGAQHL